MNGENPHNIQIYSFKLIQSSYSQRKASTYAGIHFAQDSCSSLKKLSISIPMAIPDQSKDAHCCFLHLCVCSLLDFCALRYLLSATARAICKGNFQPPKICSSLIYLDISVAFGFNITHTFYFSLP